MTFELRLGRYQDVLADVGEVDAVIVDAPYGGRTHNGQRHSRRDYQYTADKGTEQRARRGAA